MRETYEELYTFRAFSLCALSFCALYLSRFFFLSRKIPLFIFHSRILPSLKIPGLSLRFYATDFRMHTIDNGFTQKANPFFLFFVVVDCWLFLWELTSLYIFGQGPQDNIGYMICGLYVTFRTNWWLFSTLFAYTQINNTPFDRCVFIYRVWDR